MQPNAFLISVNSLDLIQVNRPGNREGWLVQVSTVQQITYVERPALGHLHWPDLDIDLALESIRQPVAFPSVARL